MTVSDVLGPLQLRIVVIYLLVWVVLVILEAWFANEYSVLSMKSVEGTWPDIGSPSPRWDEGCGPSVAGGKTWGHFPSRSEHLRAGQLRLLPGNIWDYFL